MLYPTEVNGVRTSFCSLKFDVQGWVVPDLYAINYGAPGEIGKVRGTHHQAISRTRGSVDHEADIELPQRAWKWLLHLITAGGRRGYMRAPFTLKCSYAEPGYPNETVTDILVGSRFMSPATGGQAGSNDEQRVRLTLSVMEIIWANRYRAL